MPRMSARVYNIYHFEDASPPMQDLYVHLFYSLNKLRSWFCISDARHKNRTLYMRTKVLKSTL